MTPDSRSLARRTSSAAARLLLRAAARLWRLHHPPPENPWASGNDFLMAAQVAYVKEAAR